MALPELKFWIPTSKILAKEISEAKPKTFSSILSTLVPPKTLNHPLLDPLSGLRVVYDVKSVIFIHFRTPLSWFRVVYVVKSMLSPVLADHL